MNPSPHTPPLMTSSTDYLNPKTTSMSPSTLLLGRAKEEELTRLYKDPSKYRNNTKGIVLFWINCIIILVHKSAADMFVLIIFHFI